MSAYRLLMMGVVLIGAFGTSLTVRETNLAVAQDIPTESGLDKLASESEITSPDAIKPTSLKSEQELSKQSPDQESKSVNSSADYASLYEDSSNLKKLDRFAPIWVTVDRKRVVLGGVICLRDGALEFFACRANSKEHESVVALDIPPHLIHAALLAIGAKQGAPAKYDPDFIPPSGDTIKIDVRWRDPKSGEICQCRAQDMIKEEDSDKTMESPWVFAGGLFGVDPDGKKYYLANVTGEVFGIANFPGAVLDVPYESSNDNAQLSYAANTEKIPAVNTNVLLVLSRVEKE